MATIKTAKSTTKPAAKTAGTKTTKTNKPSKSSRTKTNKTTSPRPSANPTQHRSRFVAIVVGAVAAVALVVIGIAALVNSINKSGQNNMTVETGTGQKIETQYLGFDGFKFRLKIPKAFHALTEAEIKQKYFNNVPNIVYTDQDNQVNIAIKLTDTELSNDQIKTHLEANSNTISMSGGRVLSTKLIKQGNHDVGTIQFVTDSTEGKYYNYTALISQDDKLTIITFNVKDSERETWQPVADFIIKSLDFVK